MQTMSKYAHLLCFAPLPPHPNQAGVQTRAHGQPLTDSFTQHGCFISRKAPPFLNTWMAKHGAGSNLACTFVAPGIPSCTCRFCGTFSNSSCGESSPPPGNTCTPTQCHRLMTLTHCAIGAMPHVDGTALKTNQNSWTRGSHTTPQCH